MKTINLSIQHPVLKECVTLASLDCMTESTETLCKFWKELNSVSILCMLWFKFIFGLIFFKPFDFYFFSNYDNAYVTNLKENKSNK